MPTLEHNLRWLVLAVLCIAVLLVVIDNTIINNHLSKTNHNDIC